MSVKPPTRTSSTLLGWATAGMALFAAACASPTAISSGSPPSPAIRATETDRSLSIGGVAFLAGDIESSSVSMDERQGPTVTIRFAPSGVVKLQRAMTATGVGKPMPIRLGGREISAPILRDMEIREAVTIDGGLTPEEAKTIADAIARAAPPIADREAARPQTRLVIVPPRG